MNDSLTIAPTAPEQGSFNAPVFCQICGAEQFKPYQWRYCVECDESLPITAWDDVPVEVFERMKRMKAWPSPLPGRA